MSQAFLFCVGAIAALASLAPSLPRPDQLEVAHSARHSHFQITDNIDRQDIMRANDGLFYVSASVGSRQVRFLIDTGASHVVLSHSDARNSNATPVPGPRSMILTAGGKVAADWVTIDEMTVDGHVLHDVKAAVPRQDIGLSLLGQNALAQFTSVHINGDHIRFTR